MSQPVKDVNLLNHSLAI